jgi:hypothetical protein
MNSVLASSADFCCCVATPPNIKAAIVVSRRCLICFQLSGWAGLESSLGSTGFDKMVDKDFETEKKGVWGDTAEWGGEKVVQQVIQEELTTMV